MKKLLAYLLVFCMVFSLLPVAASAESAVVTSGSCGQTGSTVTWTLYDDGTMVISGTGSVKDYNTYANDENGNLVYAIPWDTYYDQIKTLIVEEGVTYLGDHAFYLADELTTVTFPDSLTELGDQVFLDCVKLTTVNFGNGLTETGIEVFLNCDGLTEVILPLSDVDYGSGFFSKCDNLSIVTIPDTQTSIGNNMFRNCKSLTQIVIPESVTTIGSGAFEGSGLTGIQIPDTVTSLGGSAFYNCDSLTEVTIPGSVSKISKELFYSCYNLTSVVFCEGTTEMSYGILSQCENVTEITIPSTVTQLSRTFEYASGLKSVTFLGDAPFMSEQTFYGITLTAYYPEGNDTWTEDVLQNYAGTVTWVSYQPAGIASGTWGDNITWEITFDGTLIVTGEGEVAERTSGNPYPWTAYASQIKKVIFEEGVTTVPFSAFEYEYPNLTSVELKSVEVIGATAFAQCYALTEVLLPDTLKEIGIGAFTYTGIITIEIPVGVTTIGSGAFSDTPLTEIVLPEGLTSIGSDAFMFCSSLKTVVLPDSLTSWERLLFANCTALESVNIPAGVTTIPSTLFNNCYSLKSIVIPGNITSIEYSAFSSTGLEEITFLGDAPEIGELCFEDITATAYYPGGNATWTEAVMQDYGGTITWVAVSDEPFSAAFKYATTSLGGTINLNIYVEMSDSLVNDADTFVRFVCAGKTTDVPMADALASMDYGTLLYRFSLPLNAKQVSDTVTVQVMNGDEAVGKTLEYSIMKYCVNRIAKSPDAAEVAACKALLNYAAAAQVYFGYNTDNLANASLSDEDKILPTADVDQYSSKVTGSETGIKAKEATLMAESVVTVRVYFTLSAGYSIDDFTFYVDGKEVAPKQNDNGYYVETDGIPAKNMDEMHTFTVGGLTVEYGPLCYVKNKLAKSDDPVVINMVNAIYAYFKAAEAVLG